MPACSEGVEVQEKQNQKLNISEIAIEKDTIGNWYQNNNYNAKIEGSQLYKWFESNDDEEAYTLLGEYLVTSNQNANTLTIEYQKEWTKTIDLSTDEGSKFKMIVAEGGFNRKNAYGIDKTGRGVDANHGGHRETYYGLLIISASIDNRLRVAGIIENKKLISNAFGDGETFLSMFTKNQYNGAGSKEFTDFWVWEESLANAGISKKDKFTFLGDAFRAMNKPASQLANDFDIGYQSYSILAYSHNNVGNLLYNPVEIPFNTSNTLLTNVESRKDLTLWGSVKFGEEAAFFKDLANYSPFYQKKIKNYFGLN